jgi:hypothetical protein
VIFQTWSWRLAVYFDIASAKLKRAVDNIDRPSGEARREKRTEVKCSIALNASGDNDLGKGFVDG